MKGNAVQELSGDKNVQIGGNLTINVSAAEAVVTVHLLRLTYVLLLISLTLSSLPSQHVSHIGSVGSLLLFAFVCAINWDLRRGGNKTSFKKFKSTAVGLTIISILSGCSGALLAKVPDPAIIDLVKNYKSGTAAGVGFLGFGLEEINIETAARNGGIEEVYFANQERSYGLISYANVSVFGE